MFVLRTSLGRGMGTNITAQYCDTARATRAYATRSWLSRTTTMATILAVVERCGNTVILINLPFVGPGIPNRLVVAEGKRCIYDML